MLPAIDRYTNFLTAEVMMYNKDACLKMTLYAKKLSKVYLFLCFIPL